MSRSRRNPAQSAQFLENLESRQLMSATGLHHHAHPATALHAHTNLHVAPSVTNTSPHGFTPSQIRHAYNFDQISFNGGSIVGDGSGQTIAIVDAYNDPNISSDLATFNSTFGLPQMDGQNGDPTFTRQLVNKRTSTDAGWSLEISLDVEWAHAVAPKANILLVEAKSSGLSDLLNAVNTARNNANVSVVSMSWGSSEFSGEGSYDSYFTTPSGHKNVSFLAASGDSGAPAEWPAVSSNVVAVGGTSLSLDSSGNYSSESAWSGSTGGTSGYISKPSYQNNVLSGSARGNPDVSLNANPNTGYAVYDSVTYNGQSGWFTVGGTSAAAPIWSSLVSIADQGRTLAGKSTLDSRSQLLPALYSVASTDFHDITTGSSTGSPNIAATAGYDLVTGRGTPFSNTLVSDLLNA